MFKKTWSVLALLIIGLLMFWAANPSQFSFFGTVGEAQSSSESIIPSRGNDLAASPCAKALTQRAVCVVANERAIEIMSAKQLKAVTVIQDVRTGAVVTFAASHPSELDVTTPIPPLSFSKVFLSASWWDNGQPDSSFVSTNGKANAENPAYRDRVPVHEMLVGGSDSAGREMALALRKAVGTKTVLKDFERYGFGQQTGAQRDDKFWTELAPAWKTRLALAPAYVSLNDKTNDTEWADVMSLGETRMIVTALHISRFLQAIGNNGVMLAPTAREEQFASPVTGSPFSRQQNKNSIRVVQASTALRLQFAMIDTVRRGTAKSIAQALKDSGWQIGGKTGSGKALLPRGEQVDGWFAGLIFDSQGKARFTVATFVRSGGYGGENAAKISAELARYIIGENAAVSRQFSSPDK